MMSEVIKMNGLHESTDAYNSVSSNSFMIITISIQSNSYKSIAHDKYIVFFLCILCF